MPIPLPNLILSDTVPEDTIYFVPSIRFESYIVESTGEVKEYMAWNPKQAAMITNIGKEK